jgi:hypothetical protein
MVRSRIVCGDCPGAARKPIRRALWAACRAKRFDASQISAKVEKEPAVAYTIMAKCHHLLRDRFTVDTVCETLERVKHIRSRGFLVTIAGPDGEPISEDELEAEGGSLDALAVNRRAQEPPAKGWDLDDPVRRRRFMDGEL